MITNIPGAIRDIKSIRDYIEGHHFKSGSKDLHIIRFYSSYVAISNGTVIVVTEPCMKYCPLAGVLYKGLNLSSDPSIVKGIIKKAVEAKINEFGFFTGERRLSGSNTAIPFGASEILMYSLRSRVIDAAVVVCEGAGTVIVDKPDVVQGIGARMNGIFYTSPVKGIIEKLKRAGARILSEDGTINQIKGVERAAYLGYKNVAVTVNASMDEPLGILREMEKKLRISLVSMAVCTTGINDNRIMEIVGSADIVWSCASEGIREMAGKKAIVQLSRIIPVFVLTKKGLGLISSCIFDSSLIAGLEPGSQYLIAGNINEGKRIKIGNFSSFLIKARLPVRHNREPVMNTD
jgi:putative methanogenesis marker protein 8